MLTVDCRNFVWHSVRVAHLSAETQRIVWLCESISVYGRRGVDGVKVWVIDQLLVSESMGGGGSIQHYQDLRVHDVSMCLEREREGQRSCV